VLVEVMVLGSYSFVEAANSLIGSFSIGATLGFLVGMAWIGGLSRLRSREFEYMLVLAVLLLLYAFIESIGGSGAIAAFVFGVVLANSREISNMLKFKKEAIMRAEVGRFHNEVSFLVRTFFFVYLGLIVTFGNFYIIFVGVALTIVLMAMRFITVYTSTAGMSFDLPTLTDAKSNVKNLMGVLMPRGLAAAVLTQIPTMYGIAYSEAYVDIVVTVIFMSIVFTTVGVAAMRHRINSIKASKTRRRRPRRRRKKKR